MSRRELLIVSCLAVTLFLLAVFPASDLDFWWHLAVGRLHVEQHLFPKTDPFSHTAANLFWDDKEWLFGIVIFSVYKYFGVNGTILFKALLVSLTFLAVYFTSRRLTVSPLIAASLSLVSAFSSRLTFTERPWLFTTLFEAVFLLVIYKAKDGRHRLLWLLPCLMALWVNLHPAAIIGIVVIYAFLCEMLVDEIRKGTPEFLNHIARNPQERTLIAVALITPLTFLINPNTTFRYRSLYELVFKHKEFITSLQETKSASFAHDPCFYLLLALSVILFVYIGRKTVPSDLVLLLSTGYLAIQWQRNIPIFSVACIPLLSKGLQAVLFAGKRSRFGTWHQSKRAMLEWAAVAALALISVSVTRSGNFGLGFAATRFPEEATQYILANGLKGNLFNIYDWGGYHIFSMYPGYRVFIDGRGPDAYTPEIWQEYEQIRDGADDYEKLLEKHKVEIVFVSTSDRLQKLVTRLNGDPKWECVFLDRLAAVYVRSGSRNMRIANEYNWTKAALKNFNEGKYEVSLGYVNKLKILNPGDAEPWFNAGIISGSYVKQYDEAIADFEQAIKLDSSNVDAYLNLAQLYERKENKPKAIETLTQALKLAPSNEKIKLALEGLQK